MAAKKHLAIYGGKEPGDVPAYFLTETAHYLRLPLTTIRSWVIGREYPTECGPRYAPPLVAIADPNRQMLSFRNLVELHVLSSIRRHHQVKLPAIRSAVKFLKERLGSKHPLLDQQMLTDGKDLFIERYGKLVNISAHGQMEMKVVLEAYLKRIEWDQQGIPIRLFPFTRKNPKVETDPRLISIDPRIKFGLPCITGTRIPTAIIAERHDAGDSVSLLAEDYGRSPEEIEEALRYESRAAS